MDELRIGWMSLVHPRGADPQAQSEPSWTRAHAACGGWNVEDIRALGAERASLFAGALIELQLSEDLQKIQQEFYNAQSQKSSELSKMSLWDQDIYVADDEAMVLALSRLHAVGALYAAGFADEF